MVDWVWYFDLHLHVSVRSVCITTSIVGILILGSGMPHGVLNEVQYNFVKPPPSVQPDFGDKLSKDRKPEVNSLILDLE